MTPAFTFNGKHVLWRTTHYATACTESAARQIAHALNHFSQPDRIDDEAHGDWPWIPAGLGNVNHSHNGANSTARRTE